MTQQEQENLKRQIGRLKDRIKEYNDYINSTEEHMWDVIDLRNELMTELEELERKDINGTERK